MFFEIKWFCVTNNRRTGEWATRQIQDEWMCNVLKHRRYLNLNGKNKFSTYLLSSTFNSHTHNFQWIDWMNAVAQAEKCVSNVMLCIVKFGERETKAKSIESPLDLPISVCVYLTNGSRQTIRYHVKLVTMIYDHVLSVSHNNLRLQSKLTKFSEYSLTLPPLIPAEFRESNL